ncbi:MAG: histidine kinase, partial [Gammaproteobacteria bacterium]
MPTSTSHHLPEENTRRAFIAALAAIAICLILLAGLGFWQAWQQASPLLALMTAILLGVGLSALVLGYRKLLTRLLQPLDTIRHWAQQLQSGHLEARLDPAVMLEFAGLNTDINQISEKLQLLSEDMQNQVQAQTQFITQKTRSLEIIYDVAASINVSRDLDDLLTRFLHTLKDVVNARAAVVRLVTEDEQMR